LGRSKTLKFADLKTFYNVFTQPAPFREWLYERMQPDTRLTLELACGKAEYTLALAERYPDDLFVGLDLKGARIWTPAKAAIEKNLDNTAFLQTRIEEIAEFFVLHEISEIWITFPDPYPKPSKWKKRLTSTRFLSLYRPLLRPNHRIHLKTDHPGLFQFSLESVAEAGGRILRRIDDLHGGPLSDDLLSILTTYEKQHLADGRTIRYACFTLSGDSDESA
jgi:tRNA (guanine-N7-)-methyltransferase